MACRLSDIAERVGVDISTVSVILNNKPIAQKFKPQTRKRIREVAEQLGYQPNATALALKAQRTGSIGFIFSDDNSNAWANTYYARQLAGVEQHCRDRGYGLQISRYNLQNLDQFVFPKQVGQRAIDGLILTGFLASAVLLRFAEFGIPCVCLGDNAEENRPNIAMASSDIVTGLKQALAYLAKLEHCRVVRFVSNHPRGCEVRDLVSKDPTQTEGCSLTHLEIAPKSHETETAKEGLDQILKMPPKVRPTAIITHDRLCLAIITEMERRGLSYPQDLSIISLSDSDLCLYARPALTALQMDLEDIGAAATKLLLDHLEHGKPLDSEQLYMRFPTKLAIRESCVPPRNQ